MNGFFKGLAEELFPPRMTCDLCGRETFGGANLCPQCANEITFITTCCPVCGRKTNTDTLCLDCKQAIPTYDRAVSAMVYEQGSAALVLKFKEGQGYLKDYFAGLLAPKCAQFGGVDGVAYIPMTASAIKKRGYNQARLIAEELAKRLNLPLVDVLEKTKETPGQKTLTRKERAENLKGCFKAVKAKVNGKSFIVVDDVMTTGATAEEAAKTLKKKGAAHVYVATVASVEYKREL